MALSGPIERKLGKAEVPLCKVNPLQARCYAQSRGKRAKTDAVDALMLARMGHEHGLQPKPILSQAIDEMKELRVCQGKVESGFPEKTNEHRKE
jgi:transposase